MPLRDHFRPPLDLHHSWGELHGYWPAIICQHLFRKLPPGYIAAPGPTLTVEAALPDPDEFEVRVYDARRGRRLVAAVELVSPSNKDRPKSRRDFVLKCAGLLADGVSVSVVDVVTDKFFNLYAELMAEVGGCDPALPHDPPPTYAVTLRARDGERRPLLDTWYHPLAVGDRLPELPLWLADDVHVTLDLEASYEETCRYLHIG